MWILWLGVRARSEPDLSVISLCMVRARRSFEVRGVVLPLGILYLAAVSWLAHLMRADMLMEYLVARIIIVDGSLLAAGWLTLMGAAHGSLRRHNIIRDLFRTPASPLLLAQVLFAGHFAAWRGILMFGILLETALSCMGGLSLAQGLRAEPPLGYFMLNAVSAAVGYGVLAWFHMQTVKLACWCFASRMIPGMYPAPSVLAGMLKSAVWYVVLVPLGIWITYEVGIQMVMTVGDSSAFWAAFPLAWAPGALATGWIKWGIAGRWQTVFLQKFLQFRRWGVEEISHPDAYPPTMVEQSRIELVELGCEERTADHRD